MHHLANSRIQVIDIRGIASSFHLEKESAHYKSSFIAHRTLLTSFDINSRRHKTPFSQWFYFFCLIWCDLVDGARDSRVMHLSPVFIITDYWCHTDRMDTDCFAFDLEVHTPHMEGLHRVSLCQFCPNHRVFRGFLRALTLASPHLPW